MVVEAGHFALVLALALALVQAVVPFWGAQTGDGQLMSVARPAALAIFGLVAVAFAALIYAHVVSDFSLVNVFENSHSAKPLVYKISGVWGNHEGSMILWVFILALFGALVALFGRGMPDQLRANALAAQGFLAATFILFILLTSNPFARLVPAPIEGRDLNPILQDPGLAIHPPLLYLGYVGFSIAFSFAVAALVDGRIDAAWARWVRPWVLTAWIFLTLGIAMGSYWAYYTLGWGGFWFWDPVENASLMPWLAGTALLHSATVMEKRDALKVWTIFLAILAFSLSLLGTFLVRSGVLTSVHAFASDPTRGIFILAILVLFIGGSLALYAWRAPRLKPGGIFAPVSREGALVLNNLLLTTACLTVFVGTLYPLALEALTKDKISVGPPFYALTFGPVALVLLCALPFGPSLAWKRGELLGVAQRLSVAAAAALAIALLIVSLRRHGPILAPLGVGVAVFIILGSLIDIGGRVVKRGASLSVTWSRAIGLPRSIWGTAAAHVGLGVTVLGLAATVWGVELIVTARAGNTFDLGPYQVTIADVASREGPNYRETYAEAIVRSGGVTVAHLEPAKRFFSSRQTSTTQAGIVTLGLGQVYISLGDANTDGTMAVRLYWKPLVTLIWIGAMIMAFGGALSLSDRRMRIGVARRAVTARQLPQPAE
ncbi:MAG: heme lyase CcmF/NrfE family subunit [Methylobacteriaceae bacterium]|nr:heme lyase CcmF/NrfE family subunit [Methylobacteriaceae bacterium]